VISATNFGSTQWTRDRTSVEPKRVLRGGRGQPPANQKPRHPIDRLGLPRLSCEAGVQSSSEKKSSSRRLNSIARLVRTPTPCSIIRSARFWPSTRMTRWDKCFTKSRA
jgi:hypothetical protein